MGLEGFGIGVGVESTTRKAPFRGPLSKWGVWCVGIDTNNLKKKANSLCNQDPSCNWSGLEDMAYIEELSPCDSWSDSFKWIYYPIPLISDKKSIRRLCLSWSISFYRPFQATTRRRVNKVTKTLQQTNLSRSCFHWESFQENQRLSHYFGRLPWWLS